MILKKELKEIATLISGDDKLNPSVSKSGIYWHTDHMLKTINGICKTLQNSDPDTFRWKFNFNRFVIFTLGFIPRGKARAPKGVTTEGEISQDDLSRRLKRAESLLPELDSLPKNSYFLHPFFGNLNVKMSKRMLIVHTRHHLKIIRDIRVGF